MYEWLPVRPLPAHRPARDAVLVLMRARAEEPAADVTPAAHAAPQPAAPQPAAHALPPIALLQAAGNRAVGTLIARQATTSAPAPAPAPASKTSDRVIELISYSVGDWAVTEEEEREVVRLLTADADLSSTIVEIGRAGMLDELLDRVDEAAHRRDLLRLLGAKLTAPARALVEPIIQDLDVNAAGIYGSQIQYGLGRLGVSGTGAPFNAAPYQGLVGTDATSPFSGVGASGVNPSDRGYTDWAGSGTRALDRNLNAIDDLSGYLGGLTPAQRRQQVELLVNQPISTNYEASYAGALPSRLQVFRAAAKAHRLEPELVAAVILAEQRDQSRAEDARDFIAGVRGSNTSVGLGQVVGSTARREDLFADMLTNQNTTYAASTSRANVNQAHTTWLLASDEVNIAAVARYIRIVADQGATKSIASLPRTQAAFPAIDLAAYANPSSAWPEDNVGALGMYYTSKAWTDDVRSQGWGWFVQEAYRDVKAAGVF